MAVHVFGTENFGLVPVGGELFGIFLLDLKEFTFSYFHVREIVVIPVRVAVEGEVLDAAFELAVAVTEADLVGDQSEQLFLRIAHSLNTYCSICKYNQIFSKI